MMWRVPKSWEGKTAFILAGGPSLRGFDASVLRKSDFKVIAVNDSWRLAPWLDCLYFTDASWYRSQLGSDPWAVDRSINFAQLLYKRPFVSGAPNNAFSEHPQIKQLVFTGQEGLETDPGGLRHGSNSAYAAINLAYHFGVKRIVLLGYDMRIVNGRTHWHEFPRLDSNYAATLKQSHLPCYPSLVAPLEAAGVEVLNATPDSELKCFPSVELKSILEE